MKITAVLLFVACMSASARGYTQTISLNVKGAPLAKVFKDIQKQSGYSFVYAGDLLQKANPVTVELNNASIQETLQAIFKEQPFTYSIVSTVVIINTKDVKIIPDETNIEENLPPPTIDLHGHVVNEDGDPVVAASVVIKGTNVGTKTDADGNFELKNVDEHAILVITAVNIETKEVKVNGKTNIYVTARTKVTSGQEVIISKGYYDIKQELNTGDVSRVTAKEIQQQPVSDPIQTLEGRSPGLYIQQTSGVPGAYATIRIMGQNSLVNGNDPLYIVDGVPFSANSLTNTAITGGAVGTPGTVPGTYVGQGMSPFNALNPSDIESIEVLKDADATAIYGSRGANGVILITTKRGRPGDTKVDLNVYSGYSKVTRKLDMLNTPQYLQVRHEAYTNDGLSVPSYAHDVNGDWDSTRYTDWQKVLIGNTDRFTNAQATVSGGNPNTQFLLSGGYGTQGTVYPGNFSDKKASVHFSLTNASANHRFHAQLTADYVNDNSDIPPVDLTSQIKLAPDAPALYDANGNLNWQTINGVATWSNPLSSLYNPHKAVTDNLIGNLNLSYRILPGLQLKTNFGYNHDQMNQTYISPATLVTRPPYNLSEYSYVGTSTTDVKTWIIEPQINFHHLIAQGQLDVLLGATFQENTQNSQSEVASGFSSDDLLNNPLNAFSTYIANKTNALYRYNAVFGRVGYNWKDKYLLNITGRRDGSSRFGPGKRFGNFGAVGVAWIFTQEGYVQRNFSALSFGKLRVSYGSTGNDQIPDYQYLSTYSTISSTYLGLTSLYPSRIANPYYSWEVVKKWQIGLDLGFLQDRILFSTNYYRNRDNNQLVGYALPRITGFSSIQANFPADVQNSGLEMELNTVNIKSRDFSWNTAFNITLPRNKLVAFSNLSSSSYANTYIVGKSIFIKRSYHFLGINDTTGVYVFQDANGHSTENPAYPQDHIVTPEITQQFYGGLLNRFSYKGFHLDIFFQFVQQTGFDVQTSFNSPGTLYQNLPVFYLNRWQHPGDLTTIGKFSAQGNADPHGKLSGSDYAIHDASFVRLKNLYFSYTLPGAISGKAHLRSATVYLQTQNLFTITHYRGLDPETGGLVLPPLRTITAGIQIGL